VALNDELVNEMDMDLWTSATKNPDGSDIPAWLSTPFNKLATHGFIGLQGKHAGCTHLLQECKNQGIEGEVNQQIQSRRKYPITNIEYPIFKA